MPPLKNFLALILFLFSSVILKIEDRDIHDHLNFNMEEFKWLHVSEKYNETSLLEILNNHPLIKDQRRNSFSLDKRKRISRQPLVGCTNSSEQKVMPPHFIGIKNLGSTCYMNSILQTLFFVKPFRELVLSIKAPNDDPKESFPFTLQSVFRKMENTSFLQISTESLVKSLNINPLLDQDVHEFLGFLIKSMEDTVSDERLKVEFLKMITTNMESSINICPPTNNARRPKSSKKNLSKATRKMSSSNGSICRKPLAVVSSSTEIYTHIPLPVMETLEASFGQFLKPEFLVGENKYLSDTNGYVDAEKRIRITKLAPVLFLNLQRPFYNITTQRLEKRQDRLEFPEILKVAPFVSGQRQSPKSYKIHSVISHIGDNAHTGHYVSYVNIPDIRKWVKFDDTRVSYATKEQAMDENFGGSSKSSSSVAYMLVYLEDDIADSVVNPALVDQKGVEIVVDDEISIKENVQRKKQRFNAR